MKTLLVKYRGIAPIIVDCANDQVDCVKVLAARKKAIVSNVEQSAIFKFKAENPNVVFHKAANFLMLFK